MKVCPSCAFANPERFPACLVCNTLLVDVPSTPSADPADPENVQRALAAARRRVTRRQVAWAALLYAGFITGTAVMPGLIFAPGVLALYFGSSVVLILAVLREYVGQLSAPVLQGALSLGLVVHFGPLQPFIFFMLVGHVIVPGFFWHWVEMIHGANR